MADSRFAISSKDGIQNLKEKASNELPQFLRDFDDYAIM